MRGYAATAQCMMDVTAVIESARSEGRDVATALNIARVTLVYLSGPRPNAEQFDRLATFDRHLREYRLSRASDVAALAT